MSTATETLDVTAVQECMFQTVKVERTRVTEWGAAGGESLALHSFEVVLQLNHYNHCGVCNVFDGLTPPLPGFAVKDAWYSLLANISDFSLIGSLYVEPHPDHPGSVWIHCEGHGQATSIRIRVFALAQRI